MADQASPGFVAGGEVNAAGVPHSVGGVRLVEGAAAVLHNVSSVQLAGGVVGDPLDAATGGVALRSRPAAEWG